MLLFLQDQLIVHSKGFLHSSVFPLPVSLCANCYLPWIPGTNLTFLTKSLIHIFHLFDGKALSMYLLSNTPGFLYISLLVSAFLPVLLYLYTSHRPLPLSLFLFPLFQDVAAFRSVLERWLSWNGTTSLEKSQRLLEFEVLMITFQ